MVKPLFRFLVCVPDWTGSEFRLHECYYDDVETAAEEFIERHDDDNTVINRSNGIEVLIRRAVDDTVHKLRVTAEAQINYSATDA